MKSEHRHELQTNELGRVADKVAHDMGGFFELYGNRIMIGICVVSLVAAGIIYKVRSEQGNASAAWRDLAISSKPEDYKDVWERHPGTLAALWARVHEGESRLSEGVQSAFTNVESATKQLKEARETLQSLLETKNVPPEIRERAQFALARTLEAVSDGSEGDAVKAYEALLREFPATLYRKDAESRIVALNSGSGQEFYTWFTKYERPKASEKRPQDRVGSDLPFETGDMINDARLRNLGTGTGTAEAEETPDAVDSSAAEGEKSAAEESAPEHTDAEKPEAAPPANPGAEAASEAPADETPKADEGTAKSDSP